MGQKLSAQRQHRALTYQPPEPVSPPGLSSSLPSPPRRTWTTMASPPPPPSPPPSPPPPPLSSSSPRRSLVPMLVGSKRPSLELPIAEDMVLSPHYEDSSSQRSDVSVAVPQPIAQVPMQRSSITNHLRPSFVTAADPKLIRRRSSLAMPGLHHATSSGTPGTSPPPPAPPADATLDSPIGSLSSDSLGSLSDDEQSLDEYGSSSSSDEDLVGGDEMAVSDWLDEPEDAVLSPPPASKQRHNHSFSSTSSSASAHRSAQHHSAHAQSLTAIPSSTQRPSLPNSSATSLSAWLSGQDEGDDDLDDDLDEPSVILTDFMRENKPVYEVMKQVQLFRNLSQTQQEQVLRALKPAKFQNGEVIVQQGKRGSRFYMIAKGEAVVTKSLDGVERMVTHLHPGHYFGELALIYDDPRTATVTAEGDVELLYLTQEDFQRIGQVHLSLMLQQVPLLAQLNARDQDIVLSRLQPANFNDGEYIVRQGEPGTRFYMITRGEAVVTETSTASGEEKELTRLYEGHVFGEMALIYSEPRTASVRAVGPVKCLYLSKEDFDKCLLSERFHKFIQHAYVEKATRRAMRLKVQQQQSTGTPTPGRGPGGGGGVGPGDGGATPSSTVAPPPAPVPPMRRAATETKKLVRRLKDGQKVVNKYVIKCDLGKGTFGRVKLCQSEVDGKLYAVKIMHKTFVQRMAGKEDQLQDVVRREVAIMKKLHHRNVVKLMEVIDDPSSQKMYLVQEYVQHKLMDHILQGIGRQLPAHRGGGVGEQVARKYTRDLLCGLQYLHVHKVIHRDIKPENILVSADGVAKIADFGTARMIMHESETLSGAKGTPAFMAPELFNVDATYVGPSVDVWSLGATLYMMVIGVPPWLADNEILLAEKVQHDELTFPADVERTMDPYLKNLLQRMLTKDPKLRISLAECFTHDWITKEGSEPLVDGTGDASGDVGGTGGAGGETPSGGEDELMTVSVDESERAIQNIPERIDLSLSEFLEQAHLLVKTRQQAGANNIHRTGSGHSWTSGGGGGGGGTTPQSQSGGEQVISRTNSNSTTSSSPSRATAEETSRIIRAWRHHKRVQLMYGHEELSERSRELLLEQKRVAFSADRAHVTEIILPTASSAPSLSSVSFTSGRTRYQSSTGASPKLGPLSPGRRMSSPSMIGLREGDELSLSSSLLSKKSSVGSMSLDAEDVHNPLGGGGGFGRTSFTSVSELSTIPDAAAASSSSSSSAADLRETASDADLMKRPLSRKKDFLMVTSEVFRDEEGDLQSRKILFQAKDHDFSVVSRAPVHTKSGRDLSRHTSQTLKKNGSRRSITSSFSLGSVGSIGSSQSSSSLKLHDGGGGGGGEGGAMPAEIDLDGLDCVQIADDEVDEEEGESEEPDVLEEGDEGEDGLERGEGRGGGRRSIIDDHVSDSSDNSDYSDVEDDVDVDETFNELIGTSNHPLGELAADDDAEIAPVDPLASLVPPQLVQVYVSSTIRENLVLGVRSGYADAKGSRSYMEDKSAVIASCSMEGYAPPIRQQLADAYGSLAYFAVYDGHNGDETAKFLHAELHHRIFTHPEFCSRPLATITHVCEVVDDEILEKQNRSVCTPKRKRTDEDEEEDTGEELRHNVPKGAREESEAKPLCQPISFSGAAAVFTVVATRPHVDEDGHPTPNRVLYVANVGDCRAVLCTTGGVAVDLTVDHKASQDAERMRIEASGGFVHNGRLDGILALSRGFGDFAHKSEGHLVATPDVWERAIAAEDEFVLLASDGLFDVLSSQQAVNFIYRKLRLHGDVQLAAQEMVLKAQQYFAHDNISVIIVALNQTGASTGSSGGINSRSASGNTTST